MFTDIRYAIRQLAKAPGFTFVAVLTIALGIGACTSIFSVINCVLLRPLAYPDPDRLVVVNETKLPELPQFSVAPGNYFDWREQATSFENLAAIRPNLYNLTGGLEPVSVQGEEVTANFLSTLGIHPILGRDFAPADAAGKTKVALLSRGFWLRQFGGRPDVINQTVRVNGSVFTIVGVISEYIDGGFDPNIYLLAPYPAGSDRHDVHYLHVIGRMKPGVTLAQAASEMAVVGQRLETQFPDTNRGWGVRVTPVLESAVGDVRPMLYALFGAVGFMLLIACANVANLLLARATGRVREISLRVALGASRARIVRQVLSESVLLAVLGAALGVLFAWCGMKALIAFGPESLPRAHEVALDFRALGFTCALALVTGVGFGLIPARQALRVNLTEVLNDGGRGAGASGRRQGARSVLVVSEVAIALVLLVGAGLLIRSLVRLQNVSPGFRPDGAFAVTVALSGSKYRGAELKTEFVARMTDQLATLHGVQSVGATNIMPFSLGEDTVGFNLGAKADSDLSQGRSTVFYAVDSDYFKAMGIRLLRGRFFSDRDKAGSQQVAIINESMARKYFPGSNPIGQRISLSLFVQGFSEIVGVVDDVKSQRLDEADKVETYVPLAQVPSSFMTFVVRTSLANPNLPAEIRQAVHAVDPDQPIWSLHPLDELLAATLARQRFAMYLFAIFSSLALLLAVIGIYSVLAYAVMQRTSEIGIRMALGAQRANILGMVFLQGGRLVALGIAVGATGALGLTRFIASLLFGVSAQDPLTFLAIIALLAAVAAIACLVPAWRAIKVNPIVALRCE